MDSWQPGFAVRRDWAVDGSHEFVGFRVMSSEAGWFAVADRNYWRRCHFRPVHSVVEISLRDFELHAGRGLCRAPDCPNALVVEPVTAGESDEAGVAR